MLNFQRTGSCQCWRSKGQEVVNADVQRDRKWSVVCLTWQVDRHVTAWWKLIFSRSLATDSRGGSGGRWSHRLSRRERTKLPHPPTHPPPTKKGKTFREIHLAGSHCYWQGRRSEASGRWGPVRDLVLFYNESTKHFRPLAYKCR